MYSFPLLQFYRSTSSTLDPMTLSARIKKLEQDKFEYFQQVHALMDDHHELRWKNFHLERENSWLKYQSEKLKAKLVS